MKNHKRFLLIALAGLGLLVYRIISSDAYYLFLRPDVGGHGHGYLYYSDDVSTRRLEVGDRNEIGLYFADLSPDGSRIAFTKDLNLNIYDIPFNKLTQFNLEPNVSLGNTSIAWSPDGGRIAFPCQFAYQEPIQLCAWDLAKGELSSLTHLQALGDYRSLSFGGWSGDGMIIAMILSYPGEESWDASQHILVADTGTGQVRSVLDSEQAGLHIDSTIALSPDGKTILFSANTLLEEKNRKRTYALYRINADGSGLQRILDKERILFTGPVWSPDGSSFYINAGNYYTFLPMRYDLSGRLLGVLPFQLGRELISWRGLETRGQQ